MSAESQAIYLNAIPLLVLGGLYLLAAATLAPSAWRERRRLGDLELTLALVFPAGGTAALVFGGAILLDPKPVGGDAWIGLVAAIIASFPALLFFFRFRDRTLLLTASRRVREAEERSTAHERHRETVNAFTTALARQRHEDAIGRLVAENAAALVGADFAAVATIEGAVARGIVAVQAGAPVDWWPEMRLDLEHEPSATGSVVYEAAPLAVYDVPSSHQVSRRLADRVGAKSAAFVPAIADERVIAVIIVATTSEHRAFHHDELDLLQELAAETALALERIRAAAALADALERERLVARISHRVRSELDIATLLDVAVSETGEALRVERCFVRLGEPDGTMEMAAEWLALGVGPIGAERDQLPVSNMAVTERRTVACADIEEMPELDEHAPAGRDGLRRVGTLAVLASPIAVFESVIGVMGVHSGEPREWTRDDVSLVESVAHELGLALHTARLLDENSRRLAQQARLVQSAQALSSELELAAVTQRLVDEVAALLGGDAADCYLLDPARGVLRCAAVHGLARELIGFEFRADTGISGEAIALGRYVIQGEYRATEQPVPNEAYADFASAIVTPIMWEGEIRGVLGLGARRPEAFDESDGDTLDAFAGLASLALRNAEAFEERSRQARVQRGFYRIASVLGEPLSLSGTFDAVAQAANEALGGSFAAVLTPRGARLVLAGSESLPNALARTLRDGVGEDDGMLTVAAREQRLLAAPIVQRDERFSADWREQAARAGYRSLLAIPVQGSREEGADGLVLVFFADERLFTDDDLELAQHLAGAARGSLERGALFEQERTARSLAQQLAQTGGLLATALDPAAVLDEVVRQAPRLVGVETCAIRAIEDDELVVTAVSGIGAELLGERSPATAWLSGDVVQSRSPLALEDAAADERLRAADPILQQGLRAFLGVPLTAPEGALYGVLTLYSRAPRTWRSEEVEAVRALAANASTALSNAELYQRVALERETSSAILANIADGIVAVDREGHVVLWNHAAEEITGVPAPEALGRTPLEVLGRSLEPETDEGGPQRDRLVPIVRGGDDVWLSLTEAVMRDPAGAISGRIFAFRDISSDRLVEEMKSEFVSTVSQELRRPLTSIYGFAETLLRRDILFGEEERRTFLGYIASESERLTQIVDALLNVARLDTGDLQISLTPTDVGAAVSEIVSAREEDGHAFVVDLPEEPLAAEADPEKLRQVLANLVDNAVRYSPGGGTVTLAARRRNDRVEIRVEDEGIGVPQAEHERIFRKFYRGEPGGTREMLGGTGLGLFIAKGLVSAMGGRIWVDSREGRGSSFAFELPAAAGMTEPAAERVAQ